MKPITLFGVFALMLSGVVGNLLLLCHEDDEPLSRVRKTVSKAEFEGIVSKAQDRGQILDEAGPPDQFIVDPVGGDRWIWKRKIETNRGLVDVAVRYPHSDRSKDLREVFRGRDAEVIYP